MNLKKYSFKVNGKKVYNKNADSFTEMYGLTESQDYLFWFDYIWEYAEKVKVYKNASKYIKRLNWQAKWFMLKYLHKAKRGV